MVITYPSHLRSRASTRTSSWHISRTFSWQVLQYFLLLTGFMQHQISKYIMMHAFLRELRCFSEPQPQARGQRSLTFSHKFRRQLFFSTKICKQLAIPSVSKYTVYFNLYKKKNSSKFKCRTSIANSNQHLVQPHNVNTFPSKGNKLDRDIS